MIYLLCLKTLLRPKRQGSDMEVAANLSLQQTFQSTNANKRGGSNQIYRRFRGSLSLSLYVPYSLRTLVTIDFHNTLSFCCSQDLQSLGAPNRYSNKNSSCKNYLQYTNYSAFAPHKRQNHQSSSMQAC